MEYEPTNADIREDFKHHAEDDHKFQEKSTETDSKILELLYSLKEEMALLKEEISRHGDRLGNIENKIEPLVELYNGFRFGDKALKWLAGVIGALVVITGAAVAVIKFLK